LILHPVVYRDVTRQAKGLYHLKQVGALRNGLAYLGRYNSGWFCHNFPINLLDQGDWRADIFNYLKDPDRGAPKKTRYRAMKYVLIGDDLFYRTLEGLLLKCLGPIESNRLLHEGTCGTHQSAHKMKWLIRRSGYYWPDMLEDCFKHYKGC
jgi:hypothetical protein